MAQSYAYIDETEFDLASGQKDFVEMSPQVLADDPFLRGASQAFAQIEPEMVTTRAEFPDGTIKYSQLFATGDAVGMITAAVKENQTAFEAVYVSDDTAHQERLD